MYSGIIQIVECSATSFCAQASEVNLDVLVLMSEKKEIFVKQSCK